VGAVQVNVALDCYIITVYRAGMGPRHLSLLQMSAARRLALALVGCAIVWIATALALA
jgi:hypothetical protein